MLLFFDINKNETFEEAKAIFNGTLKPKVLSGESNCLIFLIGLRQDKRSPDSRQVMYEDAMAFA